MRRRAKAEGARHHRGGGDLHGRGQADFDRQRSRCFEDEAIACAFDLLKLEGDDLRQRRRDYPQCPWDNGRNGGGQVAAKPADAFERSAGIR
jgi:hypothetical protein